MSSMTNCPAFSPVRYICIPKKYITERQEQIQKLEQDLFQSIDDATIGTNNMLFKINSGVSAAFIALGLGASKLNTLIPERPNYAFPIFCYLVGTAIFLQGIAFASKIWSEKGCCRQQPEASQTAQVSKIKKFLINMGNTFTPGELEQLDPQRAKIYTQLFSIIDQQEVHAAKLSAKKDNSLEDIKETIRLHRQFNDLIMRLGALRKDLPKNEA